MSCLLAMRFSDRCRGPVCGARLATTSQYGVRQSTNRKIVDPVDQWGVFTRPDREFQMKYLDRMADFFGIAGLPVVSAWDLAVNGNDGRGRIDGAGGTAESARTCSPRSPGDVDVMSLIRALSTRGRQRALEHLVDLVNDELRGPRTPGPDDDDPNRTGGTRQSSRARKKKA